MRPMGEGSEAKEGERDGPAIVRPALSMLQSLAPSIQADPGVKGTRTFS